ncbi:MAG TPA: glycosyltransferase family 87 protein [Fimbriiglobus sp.]|jgi:hypothetical protein|nr:glycosyltransferase family 87 protein [Fimbriiglobus sp.]
MKLRSLLALVGLLIAGVLLAGQVRQLLHDPTVWPPDDFVEYWAAGRLCLHGENPYSPELLLPLEQAAGRDTDEAVMMWNPPWTLPVVMPVGALPPRVAQLAWLFLGLAAFGASAALHGWAYVDRASLRWVPWAVTFSFLPTYLVLQAGQIGPLLVFGAALFAWAVRTDRPFLAGAATVLLAIKPHLVVLLWLAILADAVCNRRWRMLAGGLVAGLAVAALPLAFEPGVYSHYLAAMRDHPPAQWVSLTLGTLLRLAFGEGRFWLQFVPVLVGVGWLAARWRAHGRDWDWGEQLPWLLVVSFVTAPYGAWHFDLVLLLVPLVHRAVGLAAEGWTPTARLAATVYVVTNLAMLGLNVLGVYSYWFAWVAPLVLVLYAVTDRRPAPAPRLAVAAA